MALDVIPERIRLRRSVEQVMVDGKPALVSTESAKAVRIAGSAQHLLPMLTAGTSLDDIYASFPAKLTPEQRGQVRAFLGTLSRAGLFDDTAVRVDHDRIEYARWDVGTALGPMVDTVLSRRSLAAVCAILAVISAFAVGIGWYALVPHIRTVEAEALSPLPLLFGLATLVLVVVPLHELGHAVAAGFLRLRSVYILVGRRRFMPFFACETPGSLALRTKFGRVILPLLGPIVDATLAAVFGTLSLRAGALAGWLAAASCWSLIALVIDLNPFTTSDGSRCLEALLGDQLARKAAFERKGIPVRELRDSARWYYCATMLYAALVAALLTLAVLPYVSIPH